PVGVRCRAGCALSARRARKACSRCSPSPCATRMVRMHDTWPLLKDRASPPIARAKLDTLQINLGYLCNISCIHCHVNAGPRRKELMSREVMETALEFARRHGLRCFDLTGGSPEMNPEFRWLVEAARA